MTGQLHVLRRRPPHINGRPVTMEQFRSYCPRWLAMGSLFGSWTARPPRRVEELKGGSVYFVEGKAIAFRMPLVAVEPVVEFDPGIEERFRNHWSFTCRPEIIPVEARRVGFLRGWRYLKAADAPPDLPPPDTADNNPPPEMRRDLEEAGLI